MAKWLMPHEMEEAVRTEVNPATASPKYILPHEVEAEAAAEKTPAEIALAEETPIRRGLIGAGQTLTDIGRGAKQTAGKILRKPEWVESVSEELRSEKPAREAIAKDPYASAGKVGTNIALGMLSPSAKILPAAVTGFALEGPLKPREDWTLGNVLSEGGEGAALAGVLGPTANYLMSGAARGKNALRGRFESPEMQNRFRIFKENQVPFMRGDISQDPLTMQLENAARRIPGSGGKEFLNRQAAAVGDILEQAPARIAGATPAQSKEDIGSTLVKSVREKYAANKASAKSLYDDVSARVQAVGAPPVDTSGLATETQKLLSRYPTAFDKLTEDPVTVNTLRQIASGTSPKASVVLGPNGKPIMKAPQLTFDELRALDSDLGALIRQGRTLSGRGEYNNKTFSQLVKVQEALRKDIENWSTAVGDPQISRGVAEANRFFRENVVPFRKNPTIRKIVQGEDVNQDTLANQMFKLDSPWLSEQSASFLTPEGVQAGRYHLIKQAEEKAMNDALASGYSPSRFLSGTQLGETGPKLFSPQELGKLEDLQELVRSSRRSAGANVDPETGVSLMSVLPWLSMKIPLAARGYSALGRSEPATRYLLADPRMYTGSAGPLKTIEAMTRKSTLGAPVDREALNTALFGEPVTDEQQ